MAITSTDIQNQSFSIDRKGYDVDEVDVFLERLCEEVDLLNDQVIDFRSQLRDANARAEQAEAELASRPKSEPMPIPMPEPDFEESEPPAEKPKTNSEKDEIIATLERQLEERRRDVDAIAQALITAQRSGEEIVANAKKSALRTQQDAEEESKRILDKANAEKQRIMDDIASLQSDRQQTRADYQDMLRGFIASATQTLTDIGETQKEGQEATAFNSTSEIAPRSILEMPEESMVATYTTPQTGYGQAVTPKSVTPSKPRKDLTGFGDADDDFEFDDID